jgi:hypothetical protein
VFVGYQGQPVVEGDGGDLRIVGTDHRAARFEIIALLKLALRRAFEIRHGSRHLIKEPYRSSVGIDLSASTQRRNTDADCHIGVGHSDVKAQVKQTVRRCTGESLHSLTHHDDPRRTLRLIQTAKRAH